MGSSGSSAPRTPLRFWEVIPAWFLTLFQRPLPTLTAVLIIPVVIVGLWLALLVEHRWRAREEQDLLVAARLAAQIIHDELDQTRQLEAALAAQPLFQDAIRRGHRGTLRDYAQLLLDASPMVEQVRILDAAGASLMDLVAAPLPEGTEPVDAVAPPAPTTPTDSRPISGVYLLDESSGEKAIVVSEPVRDPEAVLGTLQVHYRLQELTRALAKVRVEPAGFLYVVDHRGFLVAHPFQLLPGRPKDVSSWAPVAVPASSAGAVLRFTQGVNPRRAWTAAVLWIQPFEWRVIAQQPDAAMLRPLWQLLQGFLLILVLLVGVATVMVVRWARLHDISLRLLTQQTRLLRQVRQRALRSAMRRTKAGS